MPKKPTSDARVGLLNNLLAYGMLLLGFGCYLVIALTAKDFTPSRIGLVLNACSGLIAVAVNQINPIFYSGASNKENNEQFEYGEHSDHHFDCANHNHNDSLVCPYCNKKVSLKND